MIIFNFEGLVNKPNSSLMASDVAALYNAVNELHPNQEGVLKLEAASVVLIDDDFCVWIVVTLSWCDGFFKYEHLRHCGDSTISKQSFEKI